jgi:hypothetical protein
LKFSLLKKFIGWNDSLFWKFVLFVEILFVRFGIRRGCVTCGEPPAITLGTRTGTIFNTTSLRTFWFKSKNASEWRGGTKKVINFFGSRLVFTLDNFDDEIKYQMSVLKESIIWLLSEFFWVEHGHVAQEQYLERRVWSSVSLLSNVSLSSIVAILLRNSNHELVCCDSET